MAPRALLKKVGLGKRDVLFLIVVAKKNSVGLLNQLAS